MRTVEDLVNGEIIKVNGVLGKVYNYDKKCGTRFHPVNYGSYYMDRLPEVTEFEETSHEDKISFLVQEFVWGDIINVHSVGDFLIFEYTRKNRTEEEILFHGYTKYKDSNHSWETLDQSLVGLIGLKYDGLNSRAASYFYKMVGM